MTYNEQSSRVVKTTSGNFKQNILRRCAGNDNKNQLNPTKYSLHSSILTEKLCNTCFAVKPVSEFAKNTKTDDGYLKACFACSRSRNTVRRSLRSAINAKCKDCIYDPIAEGGAWRQQVTECSSSTCPLFDVRPTSKGFDDV